MANIQIENATATDKRSWHFSNVARRFRVKGRMYFADRWPRIGENKAGWWTNYPDPSYWKHAGNNLQELQAYVDKYVNRARWSSSPAGGRA